MSTRKRITLVVCPAEGDVQDRVTHKHFKHRAVKYMPLGVLSVAANLPDHDVTVIDASSRALSVDETLEEIARSKPDVLGLSAVTYRAWAMTQLLARAEAPLIVVGGPHATHNATTIRRQGAHAVFVGDAEVTFPQWLNQGCPEGVFFGQPVDLNAIPFPARQLVDLTNYQIESTENLLFDVGRLRLPMFSSKGCPHRCTYCDVQQKKYNTKHPELLLEEFRELLQLGATSIHILDDTFTVNKRRVIEFCRLYVEAGIDVDWSIRGNVEKHEDMLDALGAAGCKRFHVGIEHLDDGVLIALRKHQTYEQIERYCRLCAREGVTLLAYFILGAPGETSAYRETLPDKIRELGIQIPFFNVLTPLDHTEFYAGLLADGTLKTDFWAEYIEDPVKDFPIPSHRDPAEEAEIQAALASYLAVRWREPAPTKPVTGATDPPHDTSENCT